MINLVVKDRNNKEKIRKKVLCFSYSNNILKYALWIHNWQSIILQYWDVLYKNGRINKSISVWINKQEYMLDVIRNKEIIMKN
jgi:hypothetical protein